MHTYIVILFVIISTINYAYGATCGIGYYLKNNDECAKCSMNGYYCPGDDVMYRCPDTQYDYVIENEPDLISLNPVFYSWGSDQRFDISVCRARPQVFTPQGMYYYSIEYDPQTGRYPLELSPKYWEIANPGYYFYNHYSSNIYYNVAPCTNNIPEHSHYSAPGIPDVGDCPWACDDGFGRTDNEQCLPLCTAGITELHIGNLIFNLYESRHSFHTLNIDYNNQTCYVSTAEGQENDTLNISLPDGIFHTIN